MDIPKGFLILSCPSGVTSKRCLTVNFPQREFLPLPSPLPALHIPAVISHPWLSGAEAEGTSQWQPNNCRGSGIYQHSVAQSRVPGTGTGPGCSGTAPWWEPACGKPSQHPLWEQMCKPELLERQHGRIRLLFQGLAAALVELQGCGDSPELWLFDRISCVVVLLFSFLGPLCLLSKQSEFFLLFFFLLIHCKTVSDSKKNQVVLTDFWSCPFLQSVQLIQLLLCIYCQQFHLICV